MECRTHAPLGKCQRVWVHKLLKKNKACSQTHSSFHIFCNLVSVKGAIVYNLHHFFPPYSVNSWKKPRPSRTIAVSHYSVWCCFALLLSQIHPHKRSSPEAQSGYMGGGPFRVGLCVLRIRVYHLFNGRPLWLHSHWSHYTSIWL